MVKPHRIDLKVVTVLALGDANSHMRLFLHYNCCFLRTVLGNIGLISRTFLYNSRTITVSALRYTGIVGIARLLNIRKVIIPAGRLSPDYFLLLVK